MSYICDNCGKKIVFGRTQRHGRGVAGKRWKKRAQKTVKVFRPNLQRVTLMIGGKLSKARLCTSCLKKFKGEGKVYYKPSPMTFGSTPA